MVAVTSNHMVSQRSGSTVSNFGVRPILGLCAAEISDFDQSTSLSNGQYAAVYWALIERQVIFLRDQNWALEEWFRFGCFCALRISEQYESLEGPPEIKKLLRSRTAPKFFGNLWNSGERFLAAPGSRMLALHFGGP